jgi:predicted NUDIX family NTP pyrophosphohydrolase
MRRNSAGILVYRVNRGFLEVLLAHPGGPYWKNKDAGAWSIPKGEFEPGENALAAAKREFQEETGSSIDGDFITLRPVRRRDGSFVYAFAVEGELEPGPVESSPFEMEWPPRSGKMQWFPEVDRIDWFDRETARIKIVRYQVPLIDELAERVE